MATRESRADPVSDTSLKPVKCDLCGVEISKELFWRTDRLCGIPGTFRVVQCIHCGLVFLNPMPSQEELAEHYPDEYYVQYVLTPEIEIEIVPYRTGGRILDIGCGNGQFLEVHRQLGWDTYGVEVSQMLLKVLRSKRLNVLNGTLLDADFPKNYFDVVRLNHVIEHLCSPTETMMEVRRILKPGGRISIATPNIHSLIYALFKKRWFQLDAPRHLYYFSVKTLQGLCLKAGLQVDRIHYVSHNWSWWGSLKYFLSDRGLGACSDGSMIFRLYSSMQNSGICNALVSVFLWGVKVIHRADTVRVEAIK